MDWNKSKTAILLVIVVILLACIGLVVWGEQPHITELQRAQEYECLMLMAETSDLPQEDIRELCQP